MELSTAFSPGVVYSPFYTNGTAAISSDLVCASITNEDHVTITNLTTGAKVDSLNIDDIVTSLTISPDGVFVIACTRASLMHIFKKHVDEEETTKYKLLKRVKAHSSPVIVCTIDPTSTLLATGGADGIVKVWDLAGGYITHNFTGHGGVISALKFHGSGNVWRLASGSEDCKVRMWDLVKSKCTAVLDSHVSVVRGLDFSSDGRTLISGGRDKVVSVWQNNKLINTLPVMEALETVGYYDDDTIYTGGESGQVKLWDLHTGKAIKAETTMSNDSDDISVLDIFKHHTDLYIIYNDQSMLQLDDELNIMRRIAGSHGEIIDCCYLDDDRLAIATNSSPQVRIVSKQNHMAEYTVLSGHKDIVLTMDCTADGRWVASAGKDNEVRLWDMHDPEGQAYKVFKGHAGSVGAVGLPRRQVGKEPGFVISGSQDLTIKRWDVKKGGALYTRKAHEKDINAIDVSPDDRFFASASQDRTVKIWDIETGETVGILKGHKRGVWTVRFSPFDRDVIVTGSGDKTVKVWSLRDFSCTRTLQGHSNSVLKVGFINQGAQVVSAAGDGLVKVWDIKGDGENTTTLDNHEDKVWSLALRGDEIISGGGDGVITVWNDVTEQQRAEEESRRQHQVETEQRLDNLVRAGQYKQAVVLALELDQPLQLLKLLGQLNGEDMAHVIGELDVGDLTKLLSRVRDWNTRTRSSSVSQKTLAAVLHTRSIDELMNPGIIKLLDALTAYTRRHYDRVESLVEESYVVDHLVGQMEEHVI
uniref:ARAD1C02442p n=1 Tax=Blastobotrys adeninivorans TaxID=409370 RepID=A0A060SYN0_BLAAD